MSVYPDPYSKRAPRYPETNSGGDFGNGTAGANAASAIMNSQNQKPVAKGGDNPFTAMLDHVNAFNEATSTGAPKKPNQTFGVSGASTGGGFGGFDDQASKPSGGGGGFGGGGFGGFGGGLGSPFTSGSQVGTSTPMGPGAQNNQSQYGQKGAPGTLAGNLAGQNPSSVVQGPGAISNASLTANADGIPWGPNNPPPKPPGTENQDVAAGWYKQHGYLDPSLVNVTGQDVGNYRTSGYQGDFLSWWQNGKPTPAQTPRQAPSTSGPTFNTAADNAAIAARQQGVPQGTQPDPLNPPLEPPTAPPKPPPHQVSEPFPVGPASATTTPQPQVSGEFTTAPQPSGESQTLPDGYKSPSQSGTHPPQTLGGQGMFAPPSSSQPTAPKVGGGAPSGATSATVNQPLGGAPPTETASGQRAGQPNYSDSAATPLPDGYVPPSQSGTHPPRTVGAQQQFVPGSDDAALQARQGGYPVGTPPPPPSAPPSAPAPTPGQPPGGGTTPPPFTLPPGGSGPGGPGDPNDEITKLIDLYTKGQGAQSPGIEERLNPMFARQRQGLIEDLRAAAAVTPGRLQSGGFEANQGSAVADLASQQSGQLADAASAEYLAKIQQETKYKELATAAGMQKYVADLDNDMKRFGITTNADLQRWLASEDNALKRYGIDTNDVLQRYQANLQLEGTKYSADAGLSAAQLHAAAAQSAASAAAGAGMYGAKLNYDLGMAELGVKRESNIGQFITGLMALGINNFNDLSGILAGVPTGSIVVKP